MSTKNIIRCALILLIIANLCLIFSFSSESGEESGQTSLIVTEVIAQTVVQDFEEKTTEEQTSIIEKLHPDVRTAAHMTEFGMLGVLIMLLVMTYSLPVLLCEGIAIASVFATACIDELYQHLSDIGRAGEFKDVLFDTSGAVIGCTLLLGFFLLAKALRAKKRRSPIKVTTYQIPCPKLEKPLRIALASDLHDNPFDRVIDALKQQAPDIILIPGDLTDDEHINDGAADTLTFLKECANIAPTYYSPGNHEVKCYHRGNHFTHPTPVPIPQAFQQDVAKTGAIFLENNYIQKEGMTVCALGSGLNGKINRPDAVAMKAFEAISGDGLKLLLCHHPEYIPQLSKLGMDLVVCGHAHGGQWRIFGRGVYAPGQGIFPKYTSGIHNGNCVISRGLGDHTSVPRIFNDNELVIITLG